jgi:hypothetical protein
MSEEQDPRQIKEEVIAAYAQMATAVEQSDAAERISRSGLASCGGESGSFVKEAKREADDAMKTAKERLDRAQEAYQKEFGQPYVPKPAPTPPSAKQKPGKRPPSTGPKKRKGGSKGRRKPWRNW